MLYYKPYFVEKLYMDKIYVMYKNNAPSQKIKADSGRWRYGGGTLALRSHANCGTSTRRIYGAKCDVCSTEVQLFAIDSIYLYTNNPNT